MGISLSYPNKKKPSSEKTELDSTAFARIHLGSLLQASIRSIY